MLLVTNQPVSLGGARARGASSGQRLLGRVRAGWQASTRAAQPINQRSRSPDTLSARRPCTTWRGNFAARAAVGANRRPRACTHPARSARESSVQARGAGIMPGASADVSERTKHSSRRERAPLPARSHTRPCVQNQRARTWHCFNSHCVAEYRAATSSSARSMASSSAPAGRWCAAAAAGMPLL